MIDNDLISIGLPTFNGKKYVKQAVYYLLSQSYKNIELIVSDDASNDDTFDICQKIAAKDKRVKLYLQKKNIGFTKNFNFVLNKATGKYFMWAGEDDYRHPQCLAKLHYLLAKNQKAILAVSKFNNVYKNKCYDYMKNQKISNSMPHFFYFFHYVNTRNISYFYGLYRTDILKKIGGYHTDSRPFFKSSDYVTIFRVLLQGKLAYSNSVLFFKRDTGSFTNQFKIARDLKIDRIMLKKILRFLLFPVYYLYDFYFCVKYSLSSKHRLTFKLIVISILFFGFIKYNLQYFFKLVWGGVNLIFGFIKKIIKLFYG